MLTSFQVVLTLGRYTWKHDQVLREFTVRLEMEHNRNGKATKQKPMSLVLVREGHEPGKQQERKKWASCAMCRLENGG